MREKNLKWLKWSIVLMSSKEFSKIIVTPFFFGGGLLLFMFIYSSRDTVNKDWEVTDFIFCNKLHLQYFILPFSFVNINFSAIINLLYGNHMPNGSKSSNRNDYDRCVRFKTYQDLYALLLLWLTTCIFYNVKNVALCIIILHVV